MKVNPFLRAHGSAAGVLMRPVLTGFLAGLSSAILVILLGGIYKSVLGYLFFGSMAGILYGVIYRRAANDRRSGWIFGASTGFIFWMINPVTWWNWIEREPFFVGDKA